MLEQRVSFLECADLEFYLTSSLILAFSVFGVLHCVPLTKSPLIGKILGIHTEILYETNFVEIIWNPH